MNRSEIIRKYAKGDEDKILVSRICDLVDASRKQWKCVFTEFLTPSEQTLISKITEFNREVEFEFFGGYESAERKLLAIYPDEYLKPESQDIPLDVIKLKVHFAEITHRDILGSLMGLQIQRNRIGDILNIDNEPMFVCHKSMTEFILQNLTKIGRNGVKPEIGEITSEPEQHYEEIKATVASLRLDSVVAEAFNLSRTRAAEQIKAGQVQLNWQQTESISAEVGCGDKISLRGYGKAIIFEVGGLSRKGRQFIIIHRLK